MPVIVAIDPGMESGISWLHINKGKPTLLKVVQLTGGLQGMREHLETWTARPGKLVVEKFSPRPGARSWKLKELEPIRIEGMLEDRYGDLITWRKPEQRKLIGTLPRTEAFLKWAGYWTTPTQVGRPNADDANAATMHAIGYARDQAHFPTLEMLIDYGDQMMEESE